MSMCWYDGSSGTSCTFSASFLSSWYAVKFAPAAARQHPPSHSAKERETVRTLVRRLPQCGERHAPVQRAEAFLADDGVHGVRGVAVPRRLQRVRERVHLRLQADLDDLHRVYDHHGLRRARAKARWYPHTESAIAHALSRLPGQAFY